MKRAAIVIVAAGCSSILGISDPTPIGGTGGDGGTKPPDGNMMGGDGGGSGCAKVPSFVAKTPLAAPPGAFAFAVGKLDGNATPDLAIVGTSSSDLTIIHDFVGSHMPETLPLPSPASGAREIHVLDVDGDGVDDLIYVTNGNLNQAFLQLQGKTSPGTFAAPVAIGNVGPMFRHLAVGDIDGDHHPDVAILTGDIVSVYFQDASNPGTFLPAVTVQISTTAQPFDAIALGDVDHDGRVDLVTDGGGKVTFASQLPMPHMFGSPQPVGPTNVNDVAVGDLDGDGLDDIIAVTTQAIPLYQGPAGTFTAENPIGSTNLADVPAIGDLNGDGRADVFAGTSYLQCAPPAAPRMFGVMLGDASGYADVDGDGKLDRVTLDPTNATVTVALQQ